MPKRKKKLEGKALEKSQKRARRNRKSGRRNEKKLAAFLGLDRVGVFGGEDLKHTTFSIEAKSREKFVANKWMEQSEKNTKSKNKIPIVIVHTKGNSRENDLVLIKLEHFKNVLKGKGEANGTG